jgi:hypothetical protein
MSPNFLRNPMADLQQHTQRVIEKLGAHSKLEAVVVAMREGLIAAPGANAGETGSAA